MSIVGSDGVQGDTGQISDSSSLDKILAPCSTQEFLSRYFGKTMLYVKGRPGRFDWLFSWQKLNEILKHHRLVSTRQLKLIKNRTPCPGESYTRMGIDGATPELAVAEFHQALREGATLIIDKIDEFHDPIAELADSLSRRLHSCVGTNMYASWRSESAFDEHFDDHDTLIVQIAGRKRWKIYGPTVNYPLLEMRRNMTEPETLPLWDECLHAGDILYLPRGWWHCVIPVDEPTLHLTIGMVNPTGVSLVRWLEKRVMGIEHMRKDIPIIECPEERGEYSARIRETICGLMESEQLLEEFFRFWNGECPPRRAFGLPMAALPSHASIPEDCLISVLGRRVWEITTQAESDTLEVICGGKTFRFHRVTLPVIIYLNETRRCSAARLYEAFEAIDKEHIELLLQELCRVGLINISSVLS